MGSIRQCLWLVSWLGLLPALCAHASDAPTVVRVDIDSAWAGLNPSSPLQDHIVIERQGDAYRLTGSHSERQWADGQTAKQDLEPASIAPARVAQLRDALLAAPQRMVDQRDLTPAIAHVQSRIDGVLAEAGLNHTQAPLAGRIAQWRESLRTPDVLNATLTRGFSASHTDDYPSVKVTVTLSDTSTLTAQSGSQQYLMLPWKDGTGALTYSPAIARALHALLPRQAVNRERLEEGLDVHRLDEILSRGLATHTHRFKVEQRVPDVLSALDAAFVVTDVSLVDWNGTNVDAELRLPDSPPNLVVRARLALQGNQLKDNGDIGHIQRILRLAQSSPVLQARMRAVPQVTYAIRYGYPGTWPAAKLAAQFVSQLHHMQALPTLSATSPQVRDAALVEEGTEPAYWVVLADGRTVLWKEYVSGRNESNARPCPGIPSYDEDVEPASDDDRCIGTVYDQHGNET